MRGKLPKITSRQEAARVINTPDAGTFCGLRDKMAMLLMYRAGLRVSEVCALGVNDFDLDGGFIYIQSGKGNKDRVVPAAPEIIELGRQWVQAREEVGEVEYFICTKNGTPVLPRYLRHVVAKYSRRAGVYIQDGKKKKAIHPHTLRHCFGTELVEDGFSLPEVQELLGHEDIKTTAIYTHVRPEALARKMRERRGIGA